MFTYAVLSVICILGAIIQASIGFGFPTFAMIFLVMIFPFQTAVTICQFSGILGVAFFSFKYRKSIKWKVLSPFLLTALVVGILLTWYSVKIPVSFLKFYLGIVLIVIAAAMFYGSGKIKFMPNKVAGVTMGALSGVLNGLFAMGGPPVALYLLPALSDKIQYIACANTYFVIFKLLSLPIRFMNGSIDRSYTGYLVVSMISMTAGSIIGDRIMRIIPTKLLKKMVYAFVGISGIIIIMQQIIR